jgi:hypothetical protein
MLRAPKVMTSLSPPLQAVVALFRGPLQNVRFADIDAAGLSTLAQEVEGAAADVQAHEAKLSELRQLLAQKQEALLGLAQQALAYARIYAEGDEALSAELNEIALPRAAKPRKASSTKSTESTPSHVAPARDAASTEASEAASTASGTDGSPREAEAADAAEAAEASPADVGAKLGRRKVQRRLGRAAPREDAV